VRPEGLVGSEAIAAQAQDWRERGSRVVFTNGCFDLLHPGHLALLRDASTLGDVLVVAINDDASVRRLKGEGRPVYPAVERAELLLALRWVDAVTVFSEDTPRAIIEKIRPDVLVKGAEYGSGQVVGEDFVTGYGGSVKRIPMRKGYSTSRTVGRMRSEGDT
jgi:D-beta-D-heptose 7-phosphate kinase/D-beta-D-heptose 1-phosphate adenosyltransferase